MLRYVLTCPISVSELRTTYIVIVFEEICVLWLMGNMSILARGSSFRRTWSEYSEEKFLSELRPTFVLPMKNSVIKICHTGNISKLLNGGKAIFRSQMFNLRINDGGGGAGLFIKKKNSSHLQCWTKLQAVNPLISSPEQYSMPLCWHPKITGVI